jgi:dTDP-4-dehydrorhamnose 3,5-epimerase
MGTELINGVSFYPLEPIHTTGGSVLHAIKGQDENLKQFGECYFSTALFQQAKAWKKHSQMTCNLFVIYGKVRFIFYDDRQDSSDFDKIKEFDLSPENHGRLVIRPGIWFGFAGIAESENILLNVADLQHDPAESTRLEPGTAEIPFIWQF